MVELKTQGEEKGKNEFDKCLAIVNQLEVGGFIVEVDREGAVFAWWFGGLFHVSAPFGWGLVRMRHREGKVLKDQASCERLGA
jgi:hypothetical protein